MTGGELSRNRRLVDLLFQPTGAEHIHFSAATQRSGTGAFSVRAISATPPAK